MANSKNTIQNIPLTAPLNMNMLKTEVKQFNGYNEKNSTVFGGTLSPLYDKNQACSVHRILTLYSVTAVYLFL